MEWWWESCGSGQNIEPILNYAVVVKGEARTSVVAPIGFIMKIRSQNSGFFVSCVCDYQGLCVWLSGGCVCVIREAVCVAIRERMCMVIGRLCVEIRGLCVVIRVVVCGYQGGFVCSYQGVVCGYQGGCLCVYHGGCV